MSPLDYQRDLRIADPNTGFCEAHLTNGLHSIQLPGCESDGEKKTITVRVADTHDDRNIASMLVNRLYSWRGYGDHHQLLASATRTTFAASFDNQMIGTLTLNVDSDAELAADQIFQSEINSFRRVPGAKVCELTKFAFDVSMPSKPLLAALFHLIFIYGQRRFNCTDLFIEVNPRHSRFYEVMLGFRRIGELRTNESVAAPAQLMHLRIADIRSSIDEYAGKIEASGRSLYPYFFSPGEEREIYARLAPESHGVAQPACGVCSPCQIAHVESGGHAALLIA